jgi:hypothetical protein
LKVKAFIIIKMNETVQGNYRRKRQRFHACDWEVPMFRVQANVLSLQDSLRRKVLERTHHRNKG